MDVPTDLYTVTTQTYGTVTAVQIVVNKPLSSITDQGWSDDLYVTFQSSVGPDIVDILKYLIAATTPTWTWDDDFVRSRPREAAAVPGQLPDLGAEEHDPGLAGDRLPGPLRHLDQQRRVLPEVPARGADAGRHDHRERHRRRERHRGGVDPHGRHRDEDEGQVAAELGRSFGPGRRTRPRRRSSSGTTSPSTAPRSRSTTSTSTTSRTSPTSARRSG